MGRARRVSALIALLSSSAATAQAAVPPSGAEAIAALNAQRRANGIATAVRPSADLDRGCVNHLYCGALNPDANLVSEDPSRPGYTPLGAADPSSSPDYRHAAAMFDPTMTVAGYGAITLPDGSVHHCMRLTGLQQTPGTTLKADTAGSGRNAVPPSFTVNAEGPIRSVKLIQGSAASTPAAAAMHDPASALVVTRPLRAGAVYRATLRVARGQAQAPDAGRALQNGRVTRAARVLAAGAWLAAAASSWPHVTSRPRGGTLRGDGRGERAVV